MGFFPLILITVVLAPILYFLGNVVYNLCLNPLKAYPGPKLWAASKIPLQLSRLSGHEVYHLLELHKKYGKIIRTAPDELSFVDSVIWKDAFAHRQGHDEFSKITIAPNPKGWVGILFANRADHSRFRRLLSHSFSEKGMREQQPIIQTYVDQLVSGLRNSVGKGPQDMVRWFNWTTFDIIGRLAFGDDFSCLERHRTHPWIEAVFNNLKALVIIQAFRTFRLQRLLPFIASTKAQKLRWYNYQFSADRIASRVKAGNEQGDFWDNVLRNSDLETDPSIIPEKGMNIEEMVANASNLVLAGSETTATLLSGCTYLLLRHPDWLRRVTREIRTAFKASEEIDLFSVNRLKLTLAVLEETMRIYPPVPTQALRVVPRGGDTVNGTLLPEGTVLQIAQYAANHYPANFALADEFHPERFLSAAALSTLPAEEVAELDVERFKNDDKDVMQPFSVGARNCIGRNLAYAEMRLILAKLLWNLDLKPAKDFDRWMKSQKTYVLWEKPPLWVEVQAANDS